MSGSSFDTCKLCGEKRELCDSHIIPKFVISWLKETGSGFFRQAVNPNIKCQDFAKRPLLCKECEQRFSKREKFFKEEIFDQYIKVKPSFISYDRSLHYFLISVLWRMFVVDLEQNKSDFKQFSKEIEDTETDWRHYLLEKKATVKSDVHLFVSDILKNALIPVKNFNLYLTRYIDGTVAANQTECYVYIKFARFCIFSQLTDYDSSKWVNTKIINGKGTLVIPQKIDGLIINFLIDRCRTLSHEYQERLSDNQRRKIHDFQMKNIEKIVQSDLGDALLSDSFADIDKSFSPQRQIGRNEICPCGSGLKYKKCCGR